MDGGNDGAREEDAVEQGLERQAQAAEQQERQEQSAASEQVHLVNSR